MHFKKKATKIDPKKALIAKKALSGFFDEKKILCEELRFPQDHAIAGKDDILALAVIIQQYAYTRKRYAEMGAIELKDALSDIEKARHILQRITDNL